jgi:putative transposase
MPRPARLSLAGQAHHIIHRGNNRQPIFFSDADRRRFLNELGEVLAAQGCTLHAYVLMTNHVHLLLTPGADGGVGRMMQALGRRYAGYVNRVHDRTGTLWEGRYRSTIVDAEDYVMACYRYIEANPVRAGVAARAEDHSWSSFAHNALARGDELIGEHPSYLSLGSTPEARAAVYLDGFSRGQSRELLDVLRDATNRGWVPGRPSFRREIEAALERSVEPPVRGRPKSAQNGAQKGVRVIY